MRDGLAGKDVGLAAHTALETYADRVRGLLESFAASGIAGGACYDALIAVTAADAGRRLLTRDSRAAATYATLAVPFDVVR